MIKKILLVFLFVIFCSLVFADRISDFKKIDNYVKNNKGFWEIKINLEEKEYLIFYKIFGQKVTSNGGKLIYFILKDEIIKDHDSYLVVVYSTELKISGRLNLVEAVNLKIKNKNKSILNKIFINGSYDKATVIVKEIFKQIKYTED